MTRSTVRKPSAQYSNTNPSPAVDEDITKKQYEAEQTEWARNAGKFAKQDGSDGSKKRRTLLYRSFAHNTQMSKQLTSRAQMAILDPERRAGCTFEQKVDPLPEHYAEMEPWSLGGNANMFDRRSRRPATLSKEVEVEMEVKTNPIQFEENAQGGKVMTQTVSKNALYIAGFRGTMMNLKTILEVPEAHLNITISPLEPNPKLIVVRMEDMDQDTIDDIMKSRATKEKAMKTAERKRQRNMGKRDSRSFNKSKNGGRFTKK